MIVKALKEEIKKVQETETCFIITPIGDDTSIIRRKTDGLINNVIRPVCEKLNFKAIPAHEIDKSGSITNQVIKLILDSKLVIANLTGLNPNVMYELAIRHAVGLPILCLAEKSTELPFDITTERTIFYCDDMFGAIELKSELEKKIKATLNDTEIDNPIYRVAKEKSIIKNIERLADKEEKNSLLYIINKLDNIEKRIPVLKTDLSIPKRIVDIKLIFDKSIKSQYEDIETKIYEIIPTCLVARQTIDKENEIFIYNLAPLDDIENVISNLKNRLEYTLNLTIIEYEIFRMHLQ